MEHSFHDVHSCSPASVKFHDLHRSRKKARPAAMSTTEMRMSSNRLVGLGVDTNTRPLWRPLHQIPRRVKLCTDGLRTDGEPTSRPMDFLQNLGLK